MAKPFADPAVMPECFHTKYPSIGVIVDATEIKVVQPSDPSEQQVPISNYKEDHSNVHTRST